MFYADKDRGAPYKKRIKIRIQHTSCLEPYKYKQNGIKYLIFG